MPAYRTTVRCARTQPRRQRQDPIVANDQARKTLRPKPSPIVSTSAGGRNSQPPRDGRRPEAAGWVSFGGCPHTIDTKASA